MMEKGDTCVYFHRRLDTNDIFYVGIGNDKRPNIKSKNKRSEWWHRVVNKHGYHVEVIEKDLPWKSACLIEIALIDFFGRRDLGKGNLVNMTNGGEGAKGYIRSAQHTAKIVAAHKGRKHSEESRAKISKSQKGKKRAPFTAEHKANMSASNVGNTNGAVLTEKDVRAIIYQCKFHYYKGMVKDLAKQYGVDPSTISNIKNNKSWKEIDRNSIIKK
jgi:hypothetical protein